MDWIRVRIKATRQVIDMMPAAAIAMINGGTAERVETDARQAAPVQPETTMAQPATERAIAPAAAAAPRKGKKR